MEEFYSLNFRVIWNYFRKETLAFKMICMYMFMEYFRLQSIYPQLDILPWTQLFIVLAAIGLLSEKSSINTSNPAWKWMLILMAVILMSCMTAYFPAYSWRKLEFFYIWVVLFFLITRIVNTKKRFFLFTSMYLIGSLKMSLFGFKTFAMRGFAFKAWGIMGPPGPFQNSGEYAIQMCLFTFVSLQLITTIKPYISKRLYWILMFLMPFTGAMSVLGASSRGSQVALIVGILYYFKSKISIKNVIIAIVIAIVAWQLLPDEQKQRFSEAGEDKTSQQRLLYWKNGLEMWSEHKLTGVGYFNFIPYFEYHYPEDIIILQTAQLAHNIFIQILADLGLLGFIPYLLLVYHCFIRKRKDDDGSLSNKLAIGFNSAFMGFLIAGQFVSVAYYLFMWIHLAMVMAVLTIDKNSKHKLIYNNKKIDLNL